jgi:predicted PurR-regulated permease PerM
MNNNKFEANKKYFTISVYTLAVVLIGSVIIKAVINWAETAAVVKGVIGVLSPFLIGFFIAYLINPMMKKIDGVLLKKYCRVKSDKIRKFLSIFISYIIVIGLIAVFLFYVIPQIIESLTELVAKVPAIYDAVLKFITDLEDNFPYLDDEYITYINGEITKALPDMVNKLTSVITGTIPLLYSISVSIISWFINIIIAIIVSCYMLSDKQILLKNFKRLLYSVFKYDRARNLIRVLKESNSIFNNFIVGKTIDSLIIGFICLVVMSIFRFPYAMLISVIVGITNMIPYFGPFIGAIPGIVILLLIDPWKSVGFAVWILILQQFDGLYLGPKILGQTTGMRPLWIIFAITIGGHVAGPVGMFLGVPVVAVISYLVENWIEKRLKEKEIEVK